MKEELTVGDRVYEILKVLQEGDGLITGQEMARMAEQEGANLGQEDAEYILEHQKEISDGMNDLCFYFPGWRHPDGQGSIACLYTDSDVSIFGVHTTWQHGWHGKNNKIDHKDQLLRRKK